ncbi:MAG: hypothetical protein IJN85_02285 [Oscillospiraceae bacterium]|nr:hypothetical protein [Oscillospiraceae bacterium]
MYTVLNAQFDCIEFAESAARMIKENINGQKKIVIYQNKERFTGSINGRTELAAANGSTQILYPFSTHSNNYVTNFVIKDIVKDEIKEPLYSDTVSMEVICDKAYYTKAKQYILSYGGYSIKG